MSGSRELTIFLFFFVEQDDVAEADESIDQKTEQLISKGRWQVPGYKVGYGTCTKKVDCEAVLIPIIGEVWRSLCHVITSRFTHCPNRSLCVL